MKFTWDEIDGIKAVHARGEMPAALLLRLLSFGIVCQATAAKVTEDDPPEEQRIESLVGDSKIAQDLLDIASVFCLGFQTVLKRHEMPGTIRVLFYPLFMKMEADLYFGEEQVEGILTTLQDYPEGSYGKAFIRELKTFWEGGNPGISQRH